MDHRHQIQASGLLTEGTVNLEAMRMSLESTPDEERPGLDMTAYLNYESTSWMPFEEEVASASSGSPRDYMQETLSYHGRGGSTGRANDSELSKLHRRRAQNRQSQKQFRDRKQRAYDQAIAQLQGRDRVIENLRSEITALNVTVDSLQREKQNCLDAVVRLCQSMHEFPDCTKPERDV